MKFMHIADLHLGKVLNDISFLPDQEARMIRNIAIVSLSSGIIGEPFIQFEVERGLRRLQEYGLHVKFMPHARMGLEYVRDHPEKRAEDLLAAFRDPETDMILCAIGGDDTYRLLPFLFDHHELADAVANKVFLGFSDTTIVTGASLANFFTSP